MKKNLYYYVVCLVLFGAILAAGCVYPPEPPPSPTPTTLPTTISTPQISPPITQTTTIPSTPSNSIAFTSVPPLGSYEYLKGVAKVPDPSQYKVVVYIFVSGWWGPKPTWDKPFTDIRPDGTWSTNIATGGNDPQATKIAAFLVPVGYTPPKMQGEQELPGELGQFVSVTVNR